MSVAEALPAPGALVFPDNVAALATARELGRAGIPVTVAATTPGPASRSRYARFARVPDFYQDTRAWAAAVAALAASQAQPPVLMPTEDSALLVADHHHDILAPHVMYPYPAPGTIERVLDKRLLYAAAERCDIPTPRWTELDDGPRDDVPEPWLLKPPCRYTLGSGKVLTFLSMSGGSKALAGGASDTGWAAEAAASDPGHVAGAGRTGNAADPAGVAEAAAKIRRAGFPLMLQERIPGAFEDLVSVGLALDRQGHVVSSFTARKICVYPEPFGDGLLVERIDDPGLTEPAARLLRDIGYWGICDVEFKRDPRDGRFKLLDANPRVWLWHGLGAACGAPMALAAHALAMDRTPVRSAANDGPQRAGRPSWVSPRGVAGFLATTYRPGRHGVVLPLRLTLGALRTMLGNLLVFHDPLYMRPAAWCDVARALTRRTGTRETASAAGSADG